MGVREVWDCCGGDVRRARGGVRRRVARVVARGDGVDGMMVSDGGVDCCDE